MWSRYGDNVNTSTLFSVPDFSLPSTGGAPVSLAELKGRRVIVYFYPKDNTPGCTSETTDFRDRHAAFSAAGCTIFGISRDSLKSHEKFKEKLQLPFELLSDADETVCNAFGVLKMKNMYGRQVRGIERSTFVTDASGHIVKEWRGVKVPGHVDEVLQFVRQNA